MPYMIVSGKAIYGAQRNLGRNLRCYIHKAREGVEQIMILLEFKIGQMRSLGGKCNDVWWEWNQEGHIRHTLARKGSILQSAHTGWVLSCRRRRTRNRMNTKAIYSSGTKYMLEHFPFEENHSGKDACNFKMPNGAIGFHCFHNACSDKTWQVLWNWAYRKRQAYSIT